MLSLLIWSFNSFQWNTCTVGITAFHSTHVLSRILSTWLYCNNIHFGPCVHHICLSTYFILFNCYIQQLRVKNEIKLQSFNPLCIQQPMNLLVLFFSFYIANFQFRWGMIISLGIVYHCVSFNVLTKSKLILKIA